MTATQTATANGCGSSNCRYRGAAHRISCCNRVAEIPASGNNPSRVFENIDGVKFLEHGLGCGGNYQDAISLCRLLAGYITHPNVAGATVLSLGCQKAQISDLMAAVEACESTLTKPLLIFEQQQVGSEQRMMTLALQQTLAAMVDANDVKRPTGGTVSIVPGSRVWGLGTGFLESVPIPPLDIAVTCLWL